MCGVRGAGTSPPLTFSPKGMHRARAMLCGSEAQDPWWIGGVVVHLPDMGRPTCGSARMMCAG